MRGFTLIELVVSAALVGILAMAAVPLYEVTTTRMKEAELRHALRTIRAGLDAYKTATDTGVLAKGAGESGYPPSLEELTKVLEVASKRDFGLNAGEATKHVVFLRRIPRDPFFPDAQTPAAQTWNLRAYGTPADSPLAGSDVFDVMSMSSKVGLDGTAYSTW
jgi:general secretion pathway protein G